MYQYINMLHILILYNYYKVVNIFYIVHLYHLHKNQQYKHNFLKYLLYKKHPMCNYYNWIN